jgi:hypothetical protein
MRVLVVVPTTGGPLLVHSLRARAVLPVSCAFAQGDYRPLPWSTDYARLAGPQGPIAAALAGAPLPAFELRLSGSFDAGRSWEVPITIAHFLLASGHEIVAQATEAELVIWATGAVDLDLQVIAGDYSLGAKIEASRSLMAQVAHARLIYVLPPDSNLEAAKSLVPLAFPAAQLIPTENLRIFQSILAGLAENSSAGHRQTAMPHFRPALLAAAGLALGLTGIAVITLPMLTRWMQQPATVAVIAKPPDPPNQPPIEPIPPKPEPIAAKTEPAKTEPIPAALMAEEIRAPVGSSCRQVLFGSARGERRPIAAVGADRLSDSRLAPNLCGLAFHSAIAGTSVEIGAELAPLVVPGPVADPNGGKIVFLKDNIRQNVAYTVQLYKQDGSNRRLLTSLAHELVSGAP